jgi:hypothetical protein
MLSSNAEVYIIGDIVEDVKEELDEYQKILSSDKIHILPLVLKESDSV